MERYKIQIGASEPVKHSIQYTPQLSKVTMEARVTLILGEDRVEALRDDLISKSEYFASLFSGNFRDSLSNEYQINYDINGKTLRTFISWASESDTSADNEYDGRRVKSSLSKYVGGSGSDFDELMQLLQLSVIFAAETLAKDLTDLIACHWLVPEKSIQLWLLAKESNLSVLEKLAFATCVERLDQLPESLILELPEDEFIQLLGNIRAQEDPRLILRLAKRWKSQNIPDEENNPVETQYPFTLTEMHLSQCIYKDMVEEQRLKNNLQCVVGHKLVDNDVGKACIYCWDGTSFSELVEIRSSQTISNKSIVGRQVVGRGSNIYLVGGEYGLGTGRFETEIWRYSTISRSWYYVTSLPEPRRHMAVIFFKEKLFVIGGVGRHRLKLSTVNVYNVCTGKWSKAADVPEEFTSVPPTCLIGDKLALYKSELYLFDPKSDSWSTRSKAFFAINRVVSAERLPAHFMTVYDGFAYILDCSFGTLSESAVQVWAQSLNPNEGAVYRLDPCVTPFENHVANGPYLTGFSHRDKTVIVEVVKVGSEKLERLSVFSEERCDVKDLCFEARVGCFNIYNPNSLDMKFEGLCTDDPIAQEDRDGDRRTTVL